MLRFYCHGGPFDGATLQLASPTTVVFTANGMTGRYRGGRVHYNQSSFDQYPVYTPVAIDVRFGHDLIWEKHDV